MKTLEALILLGSQRSADCGTNAFQSVAVSFVSGPGCAKMGKDTEWTVG